MIAQSDVLITYLRLPGSWPVAAPSPIIWARCIRSRMSREERSRISWTCASSAVHLLKTSYESVAEIASRVGYAHRKFFQNFIYPACEGARLPVLVARFDRLTRRYASSHTAESGLGVSRVAFPLREPVTLRVAPAPSIGISYEMNCLGGRTTISARFT